MTTSFKIPLPVGIEKLIHLPSAQQIDIGESKSEVFKVALNDGGISYLKCSSSEYVAAEIEKEIQVLNWLSKWISVPTVIRHIKDQNGVFFLMSAVPVQNLADFSKKSDATKCMTLGARYLKRIHSISIEECPFYRGLNVTLKLAERHLQSGLVDETDFDEERLGLTAQQIFENLKSNLPKNEDLVFTHGDYCFPNIIVDNGQISGVVDLGRAGIADRYQDIGLFLRSFKLNVGSPDIDLFLKEYSLIDSLDLKKIEFYKVLDEVF